MNEGIANAPAGSPAGSGQAGGQGDGGGNLLPGQGPAGSGGQPSGQGSGAPSFDAQKSFEGLRSLSDSRHNEMTGTLKQIMQTLQTIGKQPAPSNHQPAATPAGTLGKLAEALGLDDSGAKLLETFLEEKYGPVNERAEWLQNQVERQEFFSQYPSFRPHEAKILEIDNMLESGQMSVMNLKAMAFLGMNAQEIVKNAVDAAKKEWEKTERSKIAASGGGGSGARPGATAEDRVKATQTHFPGVSKPTFTNKPVDD